MKSLFLLFTFLGVLASGVFGYYDPIECLNGIRTAVSEFIFVDNLEADYWVNICNDTLGVHSVWAAAKLYCTLDEIVAGSGLLGPYCEEYGFVELTPYETVLPDLTDEYINSLQVVNFEDIDETAVWNNSVLISKVLFDASRRTTVSVWPKS